jgi:hypothetical protein
MNKPFKQVPGVVPILNNANTSPFTMNENINLGADC